MNWWGLLSVVAAIVITAFIFYFAGYRKALQDMEIENDSGPRTWEQ